MTEPYSGFYQNSIQAQARVLMWYGAILDTDGNDAIFMPEDIAAGTGKINRAVASATQITLGSVYSASLNIGLLIDNLSASGIDLDKLSGGVIALICNADGEDILIGFFYIDTASVSKGVLNIEAYDAMTKFDIDFPAADGRSEPYYWLSSLCQSCGVTLGMTPEEVQALPNGTDSLYLIWNSTVKTYRDALSHLAAALCSVAMIDRNGHLVLIPVSSSSSVATLATHNRFSSDISKIVWQPRAAYLDIVNTGAVLLEVSGHGNGYFDLAENAFLQQTIRGTTSRNKLKAIIASAATFWTVPFDADIPCDPCLDPMDCVTVIDRDGYSLTARLTEIEIEIGGKSRIKSVGEVSESAKTEKSGTQRSGSPVSNGEWWLSTAVLNRNISLGVRQDTWGDLVTDPWGSLNDENWGAYYLPVSATVTLCEVRFPTPNDWSRGVINFSVDYWLTNNNGVTYKILLDDEVIWAPLDSQPGGRCLQTVTTPLSIFTRDNNDEHTISAQMVIPTGGITVNSGDARLSVFGYQPEIDHIYWKKGPRIHTFLHGFHDYLDLSDIEIMAVYADGSEADVTEWCTFDPPEGTEIPDAVTLPVTAFYTAKSGTTVSADDGVDGSSSGGGGGGGGGDEVDGSSKVTCAATYNVRIAHCTGIRIIIPDSANLLRCRSFWVRKYDPEAGKIVNTGIDIVDALGLGDVYLVADMSAYGVHIESKRVPRSALIEGTQAWDLYTGSGTRETAYGYEEYVGMPDSGKRDPGVPIHEQHKHFTYWRSETEVVEKTADYATRMRACIKIGEDEEGDDILLRTEAYIETTPVDDLIFHGFTPELGPNIIDQSNFSLKFTDGHTSSTPKPYELRWYGMGIYAGESLEFEVMEGFRQELYLRRSFYNVGGIKYSMYIISYNSD